MTRDLVFNVMALLLAVLLVATVVSMIWFRAPLSGTIVSGLIAAAVFSAFMGNLDRIESVRLSSSGLEAKAREVIQKAEVTQREFQKLASMTGALLIELNAAQGRWDSGNGAERDKRKTEILAALRAIGLLDADIAEADQSDKPWNIIGYVGGILNLAEKEVTPEKKAEWQQEKAKITESIDTIKATSPDNLRDLLQKFGVLTDPSERLVEDFNYYLKTGNQRRPAVWAERDSWSR